MCARFKLPQGESAELDAVIREVQEKFPDTIFKTGEIFPSETVPMAVASGGDAALVPGRWGLPGLLPGAKLLINARAETAEERFSRELSARRCAIPCSGFYEWDASHRKYFFRIPDSGICYLGGFFRELGECPRFVVVTAPANASVSAVHRRMPVLLGSDAAREWLRDDAFARACLHAEQPMLERAEG